LKQLSVEHLVDVNSWSTPFLFFREDIFPLFFVFVFLILPFFFFFSFFVLFEASLHRLEFLAVANIQSLDIVQIDKADGEKDRILSKLYLS